MSASKGITGHGANGKPEPKQLHVELPITRRVIWQGVQVNVARTEDGGRQLEIIDPGAGALYVLPMDAELSREIGKQLSSAIPTAGAHEMPKGPAV